MIKMVYIYFKIMSAFCISKINYLQSVKVACKETSKLAIIQSLAAIAVPSVHQNNFRTIFIILFLIFKSKINVKF